MSISSITRGPPYSTCMAALLRMTVSPESIKSLHVPVPTAAPRNTSAGPRLYRCRPVPRWLAVSPVQGSGAAGEIPPLGDAGCAPRGLPVVGCGAVAIASELPEMRPGGKEPVATRHLAVGLQGGDQF